MLANPVLGAVELQNFSFEKGVQEVHNTASLGTTLDKALLLVAGVVILLGVIAIMKCGGASFLGLTFGHPHSAVDGIIGMIAGIFVGMMMIMMVGVYLSWM